MFAIFSSKNVSQQHRKICLGINCAQDLKLKSPSITEKYQNHIPCSFAYEVACIDNKFNKQVALYRGQMQFIN